VTDDQKPLRDNDREQLARELTDEQLARTPRVNEPLAVLTAGQPGSGKSMIVRSMRVQFGSERAVEINPDEVRPNIPYMLDRIERGDLDIPPAAFSDAGTIAARMMEMSSAEKRNIIYDGTLSNSYYAGKSADHLKAQGYRVEIHGMAVAPDLSHARTYDRREGEIVESPTHFGRGVSDDFHNQAVKGLTETIAELQARKAVDAVVLYDKDNKIIGRTQLENGQWVPDQRMADTLREVHKNPDPASLIDAAKTWDNAAEFMRRRGAEPEEQKKVDNYRDAALERLPGERLIIADGTRVHEKRIDGGWREQDSEPQGSSPKGVYRLDTAREADPNSKDEYRGAVLHVDKSNVYQLGDDGQVTRHDRDRFKDTPSVGDNARIGYDKGQAAVLTRTAEPTPDRAAPSPTVQTPAAPSQTPTRTTPDRER